MRRHKRLAPMAAALSAMTIVTAMSQVCIAAEPAGAIWETEFLTEEGAAMDETEVLDDMISPAETEMPAQDIAPAEAETSAQDIAPAETETSAQDIAPAETETSAQDISPAETETSAQEPVPAETETPVPETIETTGMAAVSLPSVGDVIEGFEVQEIREFPPLGAQLVLFEHQRTGAKVMYVANDDTNRVFQLVFFTDAIDKTGLPHVFEHSVLDGSEKYPSRTLWFNAAYQTYQTYMNAYTQARLTGYPVASLSEAQLLKYADYYTDSCLHPLVVEDESIFREEAWRYRLEDADAPLTIEGTVYSEMLGAYDLDSAAQCNAKTAAFPGSYIGNEYGGEPAYIPDMTFEALQNYHSLYYHPSNSIAYLYGQLEDYASFLALLNEAYAPYERREFIHEDPDYVPITAPVEESVPFPVEEGSDTEHASTVYYLIVCPGAAGEQELILNTLTDLMIDDASVLMQSLKDALPSGSFSTYIMTEGPEDAILFAADNVNKEDAALFRDTVNASLQEIAENGFPQDLVDGVMATLNISTLLMREDSNVGVNNVLPNLAYSYAASGNPWDYLDYVEGMQHMDEWNQQGKYARAVSDWLVGKETTALVTTYPQPGLKEQQDEELAAQLAQVKESMSEEEIAQLVEASHAEDEPEDNTEYLEQLKAVTVDSLPEEIKTYEVTDATGEDTVRRINVTAAVDGVGQAAVFLDARGIAQEDLHWFKLITELAGQIDTNAHSRAELAALMSRYLNGGRIYVSVPREGEGFHPYLRMSWIGLDDELEEGYDLMREAVFDMKTDAVQRILETVQNLKATLKASITQSPYNVQLMRAQAVTDLQTRYYEYVNYLAYYDFLIRTEQQIQEDPTQVTAQLDRVLEQLKNRTDAVCIYAGSTEGIRKNEAASAAFFESLAENPVEEAVYDLPVPARSEALIIDSGVQFNGEYADFETLGLEGYNAGLEAVSSLVSDTFLYPMLRDQYGAYGVFHSYAEDEGGYMISYRDPNIAQTFDVYQQLHDLISGMDVDQDTLDGYILSSYSSYANSEGELSGAVQTAMDILEGKDPQRVLEQMRELKQVTPEVVREYANLYAALDQDGIKFTAGPASAIHAEADRYEAILNPFQAVDTSAVEFEDVTEDLPQYEAVRSAFETGLMLPREDTVFGAQEPATEGDLVAAIYALIGGTADVDQAIAALAEYGLTDVDPSAPVTGADADELLNWASGGAWTGEGGTDPLTRADLAELLMQFYEALSQ